MEEQPTDRELAQRVVADGDADEAEDLMQDTWRRAARGLAGFRWESAFRSWVTGIALNRFREQARRKGRKITEVVGDWEAAAKPADAEGRIDLEPALELLPAGFRTVLVLHDVEGPSHEEIGERLGIADGTSKSQLHRARRAMRRLLNAGLEMA